jgi:hypothetical protein
MGGGPVDYERVNRSLFPSREHSGVPEGAAFARDVKRLAKASLVWATSTPSRASIPFTVLPERDGKTAPRQKSGHAAVTPVWHLMVATRAALVFRAHPWMEQGKRSAKDSKPLVLRSGRIISRSVAQFLA